MANWKNAVQGYSGLWFKPGTDNNGKKHLLVSSTQEGVNGGSHDHYWKNTDGSYGVQLKNQSGSATLDSKGHIFPHNTSFTGIEGEYLDRLFSRFF